MNMEEEKLGLKWNDFQENAISAFGTLRKDTELADVTLACEDGQQVEAHKVILAASSPFFMNLLRKNKHPHPLIYMRGLKSQDLVAMVDFLYSGKVDVYQGSLDAFLTLAEELQLKGLSGSDTEKETDSADNQIHPTKLTETKEQTKAIVKQEITTPATSSVADKVKLKTPLEETKSITENTSVQCTVDNLPDLDAKIKSMMMFSENKSPAGMGRARICKVCGKEGQMANIKAHIESHHITGVSHICNICGKKSKSREGLKQHISVNHLDV